MKSLFKKIILPAAIALNLNACNSKNDDKNDDKLRISANDTMDAVELAEAGEQLVSPYTFMLADKVFDMALKKDPANTKALLYKSFLKRTIVLKGVLTRIRPFTVKFGKISELDNTFKTMPESPLKNFLFEGKEDIQTHADIQNLVSDYADAINDFRLFLKSNPEIEITLNLNPYVFEKTIRDDAYKSCVVNENTDSQVKVECDFKNLATRKLNSADAIALSQAQAGEMLIYSLYNSYSLEGVEKLLELDKTKTMTLPQKIAVIESIPTLGKLRTRETISLVTSLGSDFLAAAKWAIKFQDKLCPKGKEVKSQRRGYVYSDGLCVENSSDDQRSMALFEQALQGVVNLELKNVLGQTQITKVNVFTLSNNPLADLKSILPNIFDKCGNPVAIKDNTFGGVFPSGDANDFVLAKEICN